MDLSHLFPGRNQPQPPAEARLDLTAENYLPMLHLAVHEKDENRYFYLVSQGANPLLRLDPAYSQEERDLMDYEDEWYYQPERSLLTLAIKGSCAGVVRDLLARGEDPNAGPGELGEPLRAWLFCYDKIANPEQHTQWISCGEALLEGGADPWLGGCRDGQVAGSLPCAMQIAADRELAEAHDFMRSFMEQKQLRATSPEVATRRRMRL